MRDPARIEIICEKLKELWKEVPDWRLGQLIVNVLGEDPFYIEDNEVIVRLEYWVHFIKENKK